MFGFLSMFSKILKDHKPDKIVFAFDLSRKTFRNEIFADYKANRGKTPDEIREQTPLLMELLQSMGYLIVTKKGYEADDVIGTLSNLYGNEEGDDVTIVTGDRDALQLVTDKITVMLTKKGISETVNFTPEAVKEKYGIDPAQLIEVKALQGDSSDNIPGVPGIGEKGALQLIAKYKDIDNIYEHIEDFKGKRKQNLEENKELAYICRKLGTIDQAVDGINDTSALLEPDTDFEKTNTMLTDLELTRFAKCMNGTAPALDEKVSTTSDNKTEQISDTGNFPYGKVVSGQQGTLFAINTTTENSSKNVTELTVNEPLADQKPINPTTNRNVSFTTVVSVKRLDKLKMIIENAKVIALDTETTSKDPITAKLAGISIAVKEEEAWYLPLIHGSNSTPLEVNDEFSTPEKILSSIKKALEREDLKVTGHNIKFDYKVLRAHGIKLKNIVFDSMIGGFLLEPFRRRFSLKAMAEKWLNHPMAEFKDVIGNHEHFGHLPLDQATPYACDDAEAALRLYNILKPEIEKNNLSQMMDEVEMKLLPILGEMEIAGIKINIDFLEKTGAEFKKKMAAIEKNVYSLAGREFNLRSPKQLAEILFNELGFTPVKKTKSGALSTDSFVLETLDIEQSCTLAQQLLLHRHYAKLLGTYIEPMPLLADKNNRIHTVFNQTSTDTGRLSSTTPNLQNIPVRSEDGQKIREAFIPASSDMVFVAADYSQVELRVLAHFSKSTVLIDAFKNNRDIHKETAAKVFGINAEDVTSEQRTKAKAVNFGILYGQTGFGLARELKISRPEAKDMIEKYFEAMPSIKEWKEATIEKAVSDGMVSTILGRHRFLPDLQNKPKNPRRKAAEREAINTIIQGSAADLIKKAMILLDEKLKKEEIEASILLQVHDELILECEAENRELVSQVLKETMESAMDLIVPLNVTVATGTNWSKLK